MSRSARAWQPVGGFAQTGGTHSLVSLVIGGVDQNGNGGNGSYTLSGGQLTVTGNESLGQGLATIGSFTQTGGTHSVATLVIGDVDEAGNGGTGSYTLSGGQLTVTGYESIGQGGIPGFTAVGSFTQTGGTHSVASLVIGGVDENGNGGTGSYMLSGGQLTVTGYESIGQGLATSGSFTQTGGTHTVASLVIGDVDEDGNGGTGSYALSGSGLLTVTGNEAIGQGGLPGSTAVGSFTQTGGTHNVASLVIGGVDENGNGGFGSYTLSAGRLTVTGTESIGQGSATIGSFVQTGGTHSVASLVIGDLDEDGNGGTGSYTLDGGLLILSSLSTESGSATFSFGGGTLQAGDAFSTSLPLTLSKSGSNPIFDTNGHSMNFSGQLTGTGGLQKVGSGLLILSGTNTYSGGTFVSDGILLLESNKALADGTSLAVGADASAIFAHSADATQFGSPDTPAVTPVPEPGTAALSVTALFVGFQLWRRRKWILPARSAP